MTETLSLILQVATLLGIIFAIYKYFRSPDEKAQEEIALIKEACKFRHQAIDENIVMIKNNHLAHIERDMTDMKMSITRILTILEEREKSK